MSSLASLSLPSSMGVALLALLSFGCTTDRAPRARQGVEGDTEGCRPTVLLAARGEHVEVLTEWEDAGLVLVGCADRLQSIAKQQRAAVEGRLNWVSWGDSTGCEAEFGGTNP